MSRTLLSRTLFALAALSALALLGADAARTPAHAQTYPWCAIYAGRGGGGTNCGFSTLAQCRATISGIGGTCEPNPAYRPTTEGRGRRQIYRERY